MRRYRFLTKKRGIEGRIVSVLLHNLGLQRRREVNKYLKTIGVILWNFRQVGFDHPIRLFLKKSAYGKSASYAGCQYLSHFVLKETLIRMESKGYIWITKGIYFPRAQMGYATEIRATDQLRGFFTQFGAVSHPVRDVAHDIRGIVVLRGKDKVAMDFSHTEETERIQADLQSVNSFLGEHTYEVGGVAIDQHDIEYTCIFSQGSLQLGGRVYSQIQNMQSCKRRSLRIDGDATVELDLKCNHLRMLYHRTGATITAPANDLYSLPDIEIPREAIKEITNLMINCSSLREVGQAYNDRRGEKKKDRARLPDGVKVRNVAEAIAARHCAVGEYFYQSEGLKLQRIEGQICLEVMKRMCSQRKVCLTIHDSFICRAEDEELMRQTIAAVYREHLNEQLPIIERK